MATIYVVTSGSYSEYGIDAIFDSKEKAEAFLAYQAAHNGDSPTIEEWELNQYYDPIQRGLKCYKVEFRDMTQGDAELKEVDARGEYWETAFPDWRSHDHVVYQTILWAHDETAALKIANERRVRYLVEHPLESRTESQADGDD